MLSGNCVPSTKEQKEADLPDTDNQDPELITFLQHFDKLLRNAAFMKRL